MSDKSPELEKMIQKIREDAREKCERIEREARDHVDQRWKIFEKQKEKTLKEAETKAEAERDAIWQRHNSALMQEKKRIQLKAREKLMREAQTAILIAMEAAIARKEYDDILLRWILEGVVALDCDVCVVNASTQEKKMLTGDFIERTVQTMRDLTGRRVHIDVSDEEPLPVQGVIVAIPDGKIAYNNQVPVRYKRREAEIRRVFLEELIDPLLAQKEKADE